MLFPFFLIGFGAMGWIASFGLTLERIKVAGDPGAATACDISPFISCKSVMLSEQAALFGFPNPLIGLAAFFAPVLVGFAMLAGAKFASWFWQGLLAGHVLAMAFVFWLFSQSVFSIGSLCIYCMVAWTATIPLFWAIFGSPNASKRHAHDQERGRCGGLCSCCARTEARHHVRRRAGLRHCIHAHTSGGASG